MKNIDKHTEKVDLIINTPLVDKQVIISSDFVDQVMKKVESLSPAKPYLKYMVNVAASLAFIMLMGNLMMVINQINTSSEDLIVEEWVEAYQSENNSHWSVYYDIELLASTDKIK